MILLQQRYRSADAARQAELDQAAGVNATSGIFSEIVTVDGAARRWTFADLFGLAAERFPGRPCVVANSDISFDESLRATERLQTPNTLIALTRWDDDTAPSMEGRVDPLTWRFYSQSQDAWVFLAGGLPPFRADFHLGVPRCENRLAYEAAAAGTCVWNPALSVRARHHHATNIRSWKRSDYYRGPLFFPRLTTLTSTSPEGVVIDRCFLSRSRWTAKIIAGEGLRTIYPAGSARRRWPRFGFRSPIYRRD